MDDHFCVNGPAWLQEGPRALGRVQSMSRGGQASSVATGAMVGTALGAGTVWLRLSCSLSPSLPLPAGPSTGVSCWHRTCTRLHQEMAEKGKTHPTNHPDFGCSPSAAVLL